MSIDQAPLYQRQQTESDRSAACDRRDNIVPHKRTAPKDYCNAQVRELLRQGRRYIDGDRSDLSESERLYEVSTALLAVMLYYGVNRDGTQN